MFGLGYQELVVLFFLILIGGSLVSLGARRGAHIISGPTLVLRTFRVAESPTDGNFVEIVGRPSGLIGWFLTILGVAKESSLRVTSTEVCRRQSSLFGERHEVVPLTDAVGTRCEWVKPLWLLALGCLFLFGGLFFGLSRTGEGIVLLIGLIAGIGCLVAYWLQKTVYLGVHTKASGLIGVKFKRSVIENVAVDIGKARQAAETVHSRTLESRLVDRFPATVDARQPLFAPAGRGADRSGSGTTQFCTTCGAATTAELRFCPRCGSALS